MAGIEAACDNWKDAGLAQLTDELTPDGSQAALFYQLARVAGEVDVRVKEYVEFTMYVVPLPLCEAGNRHGLDGAHPIVIVTSLRRA